MTDPNLLKKSGAALLWFPLFKIVQSSSKKCLNLRQKLGTRNVIKNLKDFFVFMSMLKSHSLTLTLSQSHTLSISHLLTLDMLNNFCFHLYAEKSLFIGENCNTFITSSAPPPSPVSLGVIELVPS